MIHLRQHLLLRSPLQNIFTYRLSAQKIQEQIEQRTTHSLAIQRERMKGIWGKLNTLSPLSILERGYSITRKFPNLEILRSAREVSEGDPVEVQLHQGKMLCKVTERSLLPSRSS